MWTLDLLQETCPNFDISLQQYNNGLFIMLHKNESTRSMWMQQIIKSGIISLLSSYMLYATQFVRI